MKKDVVLNLRAYFIKKAFFLKFKFKDSLVLNSLGSLISIETNNLKNNFNWSPERLISKLTERGEGKD